MTLKLDLFRSKKALYAVAALSLVGTTLVGAAVTAQTTPLEPIQWDRRRLEQLDRNVRRIERALTQRNAAGQPVIVEPDPEVVALQGRVQSLDRRLQDIEATVQRVNGDLEDAGFQLAEAGRDNAALRTRLSDAEERIEALEEEAEAAAALNGPITANSPTGDAARDLAVAIALSQADAVRGDRALQTVIVTWPDTIQAREANLRLGDMRSATQDLPGAVQAYAAALSGWPTTPWAAEATIKLASALQATDRDTQACGALGEFNRRYAAGATAALRTRAGQVRTRAGCA